MILGLTGGIASGKSTVTKLFKREGVPVIDTDLIARAVVKKGTKGYREIVKHFGKAILYPNHVINRKMLGEIIFAEEKKRALLNAIVHPLVEEEVKVQISELLERGHKLIVIDVPLLFESGFDRFCDKTLVVYVNREIQLARLMKRDNISEEYALRKITAQMPLDFKVERADFVIDNSGNMKDTINQFKELLRKIRTNY